MEKLLIYLINLKQFLEVDKSVEAINLLIPTISKTAATTSTTDLTFSINVGVGTLQPEMVEKSMETETIKKL